MSEHRRVWLFPTLGSPLLAPCVVFLFYLDVAIPPAQLPSSVADTDFFGIIFDALWHLSVAQQTMLAALATAASVLGWRFVFGEQPTTAWSAAGTVVALTGWALRQWAKLTLADNFQYQISTPASLLTTGPYAWLVHPGYSGVNLHVIGISILCFASPNWHKCRLPLLAAIAAVMIALQGRIRIAPEERLLEEKFGDAWTAHVAHRWRVLAYSV